MRTIIIEDEMLAASYLKKLLLEYDSKIEVLEILDSAETALSWLSKNSCDLIFADIHLGDTNSFFVFEQMDIQSPVIFTTAFDQYAIQAFKLNSIDYLLKPIDKNALVQAIEKYKKLQILTSKEFSTIIQMLKEPKNIYKERYLVSTGQKLKSISSNEIAYFFADQKYVYLSDFTGKQFIVNDSLETLETQLNPTSFFRINRQFIISFGAIKNMVVYSKSRVKIELNPPIEKDTIVSVERSSNFKRWLDR